MIETLSNDLTFLNDAKIKISEMFQKGGYSETQRLYLRDVMFFSWFQRGQKLRKNDIFDMFCIGCLDYIDNNKKESIIIDTSSYIISFDDTIKEFLRTNKPRNLAIINSI